MKRLGLKAAALVILIAGAAVSCASPYGGPGGCLVLGSGNCTTNDKAKP